MDSSIPIIIYMFLTIIYFYLDYTMVQQWSKWHDGLKITHKETTVSNILLIAWFILVFACNAYFNINLSKDRCGVPQVLTAFIYTLVPYILILGLLMVILNFFPSFLIPFSNTIGYFLVDFFGDLNGLFSKILKNDDKKTIPLIDQICNDKSLLLNEITSTNFSKFMDSLKKGNLVYEEWEHHAKLYNLVVIKEMISKIVWLLLTGILIIQTSYNAIMNIDCDRTNVDNSKINELVNEQLDDENEENTEKWDL